MLICSVISCNTHVNGATCNLVLFSMQRATYSRESTSRLYNKTNWIKSWNLRVEIALQRLETRYIERRSSSCWCYCIATETNIACLYRVRNLVKCINAWKYSTNIIKLNIIILATFIVIINLEKMEKKEMGGWKKLFLLIYNLQL